MWPFRKQAPSTKAERLDGFINELTGRGVEGVDKSVGGYFVAEQPFETDLLENLYSANDLASLCVDVVPDEALRVGFDLKSGDPDEDKALGQWMREIGLLQSIGDGARWGRLYGAGFIILGTKDSGKPEEPLELDKIQSLDWLMVSDRQELTPQTWYPSGKPRTYHYSPLNYTGSGTTIIHESRLVAFGGVKTTKRRKLENSGFDLSVLQRVYKVIDSFDNVFTNIGVLLADGNQAVFQMSGLADALAGESDEAGSVGIIKARFRLMNAMRSVHRALVLDAGNATTGDAPESFERQVSNFSGLAGITQQFILRLSSALRIPVTILMGQSPAGLSATGESDLRQFYDRTDTYRAQELDPAILRVVEVLRASKAWDAKTDTMDVYWPSLWSESDSERATARKTQAETDALYITNGVLSPEEVTVSRFGGDGYSFDTTLETKALDARQKSMDLDYEELPSADLEDEPEETPLLAAE